MGNDTNITLLFIKWKMKLLINISLIQLISQVTNWLRHMIAKWKWTELHTNNDPTVVFQIFRGPAFPLGIGGGGSGVTWLQPIRADPLLLGFWARRFVILPRNARTEERTLSKGRKPVDTRRLFSHLAKQTRERCTQRQNERHPRAVIETRTSSCNTHNSESVQMCLWSKCKAGFNRSDAHKAHSAFLGH